MPLAGTRKNCAFLLLVQGMKYKFQSLCTMNGSWQNRQKHIHINVVYLEIFEMLRPIKWTINNYTPQCMYIYLFAQILKQSYS